MDNAIGRLADTCVVLSLKSTAGGKSSGRSSDRLDTMQTTVPSFNSQTLEKLAQHAEVSNRSAKVMREVSSRCRLACPLEVYAHSDSVNTDLRTLFSCAPYL